MRRRAALGLMACAWVVAAACGVDAVGTSSGGASEGPDGTTGSPAAPTGTGPTSMPDGSDNPIEVIGEPDAAVDADVPDVLDAGDDADAADGSDGNVCTLNGGSCTETTAQTCCAKSCNAYKMCGACSSSTKTKCTSTTQCCTGFFCGKDREEKDFHCYTCLPKNAGCLADIQCCSGDCGFDGRCN